MKKNIVTLIAVVAGISLTAFALMNRSEQLQIGSEESAVEFLYDVGSRYSATITKENLHAVTSVVEIVPKEADWGRFPIHTLQVSIFDENEEITETGNSANLNAAQLQLLQSVDYSYSFRLIASCSGKYEPHSVEEGYDLTYFITVTPEKEAEYNGGKEAILSYLKENSKEAIAGVQQDKLQSGRLFFTVSKNGTISNVILSNSSGYDSIDNTMIELVSNPPGKWKPALNSAGEKIDQQFRFSFGAIGC